MKYSQLIEKLQELDQSALVDIGKIAELVLNTQELIYLQDGKRYIAIYDFDNDCDGCAFRYDYLTCANSQEISCSEHKIKWAENK